MPSSGVQTCARSEEHTSELQSRQHLACRLLLEKKDKHPDVTCAEELRWLHAHDLTTTLRRPGAGCESRSPQGRGGCLRMAPVSFFFFKRTAARQDLPLSPPGPPPV